MRKVLSHEAMSLMAVSHTAHDKLSWDALWDYIAKLEAAQRWTPVSERLPEIDDDDVKEYDVVLTYPYEQKVITATWSYDNTGKAYRRLWLDCRSDEWGAVDITEYVTHWRERPTPPEVQDE